MNNVITMSSRLVYEREADGNKRFLNLRELTDFIDLYRKSNRLFARLRDFATERIAVNFLIKSLAECGYVDIRSHFFDFHIRDGRIDYVETSFPLEDLRLSRWERLPHAQR